MINVNRRNKRITKLWKNYSQIRLPHTTQTMEIVTIKELSRELVIENNNQPSSSRKKTTSIFIGTSIYNNPFWGIHIFGNNHISWLVLNPHLTRHFVRKKTMVIQAAHLRSTKHSDPHPDPPGRVTGCTAKAAMSSIKDKTLTWSRDVQGVTRCAPSPVRSGVIKAL